MISSIIKYMNFKEVFRLKRITSIFLALTLALSLASCSSEPEKVAEPVVSSGKGEYILTTNTGTVSMFDNAGNVVSSLSLSTSSNSEFLYCIDEGHIYTASLSKVTEIPKIMYAVDKQSRKLTMLTVYNDTLVKRAEMILSDGNISNIYAYNGIFYYSVDTDNVNAKPYSFERRQQLNKNGTLSYIQTVPIRNTGKSTYVYMENYFDQYLEATGLNQYVSLSDKTLLNIPDDEHAVYEIPTDVKNWTANNTDIYFFSDTQMGTYDILTNKITVYYGAINPIDVQYLDGMKKRNYLLSDFGDGSGTTMIMSIEYDDMKVDKAIQIDYSNPMKLAVEKDKYIMAIYKVTNSEKTFAQLRVMDYETCNELYIMGVDYLPTKVLASGEIVYLFNPYEDYFLTGSVHSGSLTEISKDNGRGNQYTDIFLVDLSYTNEYFYDGFGRYVNKDNHLINEDGELIDDNNDRVNILGQRIDALGRAINKEGDLIDRYNNVIDIDGNIIRYVINADGFYYNSNGEKVDSDGTVLIRDSEGNWIRPEESTENQIVITGHYDEHGNFIINKDILDAYPNAYELWQQQNNSAN